jgi:hypothetical protein
MLSFEVNVQSEKLVPVYHTTMHHSLRYPDVHIRVMAGGSVDDVKLIAALTERSLNLFHEP